MSINEVYDLSQDEKKQHEKDWGTYNDFPLGWKEITLDEFSQSMYFYYTPVMVEYRQMHPQDGSTIVSAHLLFFHDKTGVAIVKESRTNKVKFFTFGCDHEWGDASEEVKKRGIRLFQHDHAQYCPKCGFFTVHDSSD